jgi:hypothetical protein
MTRIFRRSSIPAKSMMIGISTGGGIARRNSRTGSVSARSHRLDPMSTPSPIPTATARK